MKDGLEGQWSAVWKFYFENLREHWQRVTLGVIAALFQSVSLVPVALLVRTLVDDSIPDKNNTQIVSIGIFMGLAYLITTVMSLWNERLIIDVNSIFIREIRRKVIQRIYAFTRTQFLGFDKGILHTIMVEDSSRVSLMSYSLLSRLIPSALVSLGLFVVLLYMNWQLLIILMIIVPILTLLIRRFNRDIRSIVSQYHRIFEQYSKGMRYVLDMMDLTTSKAAEPFETARQEQTIRTVQEKYFNMNWRRSVHRSTQDLVIALGGIIVLVVGGMGVLQDWISVGEVISFYIVIGLLSRHMSLMLMSVTDVMIGRESLLSLYELLSRPQDPAFYSGKKKIELQGEIVLEQISFSYDHVRVRPVLENADLRIPAGKTTVLLGANGSGKTSLVNLILAYYRPQAGQLKVDGSAMEELDIAAFRRQIGLVPQNPLLFLGTVRENITYGNPEISEKHLQTALNVANAEEFIARLSEGLETIVGEDALFLSGGQRQRIAIARALIGSPRILILDEPTNHLDASAISLLMNNLFALDPKPTILIISHEQEVIRYADQVYRLADRKIQYIT